jgi:RimJ/RimL family protein N-acetyltransferase
MHYGKECLALERMVCLTHLQNAASVKIIEKLGMWYSGPVILNGRKLQQYLWEKSMT